MHRKRKVRKKKTKNVRKKRKVRKKKDKKKEESSRLRKTSLQTPLTPSLNPNYCRLFYKELLHYGCVYTIGFTCVSTSGFAQITYNPLIYFASACCHLSAEVVKCPSVFKRNIIPQFHRGKIILGHLAQRMLRFIPRDTGADRPSESTAAREGICPDSTPIT